MDYSEFEWGKFGELYQFHKDSITNEIFVNRIYEKIFKVEDGDIVVDFGSSVGPFPFTLHDRKVKYLYCIEPSPMEFPTLLRNVGKLPFGAICINKGLAAKSGKAIFDLWGENKLTEWAAISFKDFRKKYKLKKIDFLKTDCEGAEYDIFNIENFSWIFANVRKIAGEFHLSTPELIEKFIKFRDLYLKTFNTAVTVYTVDGIDVTDRLYTDWFIQYFNEVIIYIDNKKIN